MDFMDIVWLALAAVIGLLVGALVHKSVTTKRIGDADELAKRIVEEARKEAQAQKKEILIQGQDDLFNQKRELENEIQGTRARKSNCVSASLKRWAAGWKKAGKSHRQGA